MTEGPNFAPPLTLSDQIAARGESTLPPFGLPAEGRQRVAIENVQPSLDGGRFAVKRIVGQPVTITADVFADGHDHVACRLLLRMPGQDQWSRQPMQALGNDAWQAQFDLSQPGRYEFTIEAWIDHFDTWLADLRKRLEARQEVSVDLRIGAEMIAAAIERANNDPTTTGSPHDVQILAGWKQALLQHDAAAQLTASALDELGELMAAHPDLQFATRLQPVHAIIAERHRAQFSSWYELFPRSTSDDPTKHGTFREVIKRLPYVASLGFDVLYLPPIHPVGHAFRKGKNNSTTAEPGEPGSPWAIGAREGGHTEIHPQLGTLEDFAALVAAVKQHGMELALDIAYQCSPDHPYATAHREWFKVRPDGTIQYAENPPKKYQDIYPFDFESADWQAMWHELRRVVLYWCQQGVRIFRVDNPHTKAFAFWEWMIAHVKQQYPDTIFLSEAFTRPKVMYRLAKLGFSQSYTYFTWRSGKQEIIEYFTELTQPKLQQYFRPNLWPNTPDILPGYLQTGQRSTFETRVVLAATLGASYGIYGPAYELLEHEPLKPGSEEYLNSEKYEIRQWDLNAPHSLAPTIAKLNKLRHDQPALQADLNLVFHETDNDALLCYSKRTDDGTSRVLVVVNLDFNQPQHGHVLLDMAGLMLRPDLPVKLHDILSNESFEWQPAEKNFVKLDPAAPYAVHVMVVQQ
jgi:starch synthase (maltosyl-transferring)